MRNLSRREFVQLCAATGAALSLSEAIKPEIIEAFSGPAGGVEHFIIWIVISFHTKSSSYNKFQS